MSGAKEIRNKIKSIQNTKKITKAMEMVAASKMKKVQDSMSKSRPYSEKIKDVNKAGNYDDTIEKSFHEMLKEFKKSQ